MRVNNDYSYIVLRVDTYDIYIRELHKIDEYLSSIICVGCIYYKPSTLRNPNFSSVDDVRALVSAILIQISKNRNISGSLNDIFTDGILFKFIYGVFEEKTFLSEVKRECLSFIKPKYIKHLNAISSLDDLDRLLSKVKYF